jgi:hypothetical protein
MIPEISPLSPGIKRSALIVGNVARKFGRESVQAERRSFVPISAVMRRAATAISHFPEAPEPTAALSHEMRLKLTQIQIAATALLPVEGLHFPLHSI